MFEQLLASLTDGMLVGVVYGLAAMGLIFYAIAKGHNWV